MWRVILVTAAVCGCGPGLASHPGARPSDPDVTVNPPEKIKGVAYISWYQGTPVYDRQETDDVIDAQLVPLGATAAYVTQMMTVDASGSLIAIAGTETTAGLTRVLSKLHNSGINTGITLVLDVDRMHWAPDAATQDTFFASYTQKLVDLATLCEAQHCTLFSIGFELESVSNGFATQWANVITAVREHFHGTITYNFFVNEASSATFVDQLDIIGIDALFPLACSDTPSASDIAAGWSQDNACPDYDPLGHQAPLDYLSALASAHQKKILFMALAFRSEQGAAKEPDAVSGGPTDNSVQNALWQGSLQVLFDTDLPWFAGLYVWEMMPYITPEAHTSTVGPNDYTPQNKSAYTTIQRFFAQ